MSNQASPKSAVIEIDGCKISPEFVKLVKDTFFDSGKQFHTVEFRDHLFMVQSSLISALSEGNPSWCDDFSNSLIKLHFFCRDLEQLHEDGLF